MSSWYYYDINGQKRGPVTGGQLKGLAKAGLISPGTIVENDAGKSALAENVKGLSFPDAISSMQMQQPAAHQQTDSTGLQQDFPPEFQWQMPETETPSGFWQQLDQQQSSVQQTAAQGGTRNRQIRPRVPGSYDYNRIATARSLATLSICTFGIAGAVNRILGGILTEITNTPAVIPVDGAVEVTTEMAAKMPDGLLPVTLLVIILCSIGTALAAVIFSIYCMARLARAINYGVGTIIIFAICLPLPLLCFIPLFLVYFRAGKILKQGG